MDENGLLLVAERIDIIPSGNESSFSKLLDLTMLVIGAVRKGRKESTGRFFDARLLHRLAQESTMI